LNIDEEERMAVIENDLRDVLPAPVQLFETPQQAHDCMMQVVNEVCQQLKAEGQPVPPFKQFYADVRAVWNVWRLYAPQGN
jgi:hypothetical protein